MSARSLPEPATVDECIAVMTDVIVQQFHPEHDHPLWLPGAP